MISSVTRTGLASLPLHYGQVPRWLFDRMTKLAREISSIIVAEFGPEEMLRRLSDPCWFQAFGCVLGYDWHSSGVTTVLCGALKEGIKGLDKELGFFVAGGKGRTSRQTPAEIQSLADAILVDPRQLVYASKLAAKVDNSALQDGYQLYHHTFLFTASGSWSVVQQGMNESTHYARRYHWLGEKVTDFVCEPHAAICSQQQGGGVLNLVCRQSTPARIALTDIVTEQRPEVILAELKTLKRLDLPRRHQLSLQDIHPDKLEKPLFFLRERQPQSFEELLGVEGVGPKTMRALSLIAELVYGVKASFHDPARYSFAHGGKDGYPFPVDRQAYDQSIEILARAVRRAKVDFSEKEQALHRLDPWLM